MIYLGIDPGKTTGIAWVAKRENKVFTLDFENIPWHAWPTWVQVGMKESGKEFRMMMGEDDPACAIERLEDVAVVCENFIHRPDRSGKKQDAWLKSPVERMIGALWFRSLQLGYKFYLSEPTNKPIGYRLAKVTVRPSHGVDWQDAMAHAYFAAHNGTTPNQRIIW